MKIVINVCFGGFSVSDKLMKALNLPSAQDNWNYLDNETFNICSENPLAYRCYPPLIEAIEKIGNASTNGPFSNLKIIDIPDNVDWYIHEYDGYETIHEVHRIWQ